MKVVAIHSHKGGVGKTTAALLLAKYTAREGKEVCVLDFDFIGAGMADLLPLKGKPKRYLENFFLSAEPHKFRIGNLLTIYQDDDISPNNIHLMLNHSIGKPGISKEDGFADLETAMLGMIADEPHYRLVESKTKVLLDRLEKRKVDLAIFDCHPGLGFVSHTVSDLADLNIYVMTPNRADAFGLFKAISRRSLYQPNAMILFNRFKHDVPTDYWHYLDTLIGNDGLVGDLFSSLLSQLTHLVGKDEKISGIPESDLLFTLWYLGGSGHLPSIEQNQNVFDFCSKALSSLQKREGG